MKTTVVAGHAKGQLAAAEKRVAKARLDMQHALAALVAAESEVALWHERIERAEERAEVSK